MRQNEENTTRQNLTSQLKAIHSANILGGIWVIRDFSLNEFHAGIDPECKNEHPLFKEAAEQWAFYSRSAGDFDLLTADYIRLLTNFSAWLSENGLTEAASEIARIQSGLAMQDATRQGAPAKGARWRELIACTVALCGAGLLQYVCANQEPWQHFVSLLALLLVAVPVWVLATRYAKRSAPVPIAQPTR